MENLFSKYYSFIRDLRLEIATSGTDDFRTWIKFLLKNKRLDDTITMDLFPELYFAFGSNQNGIMDYGKKKFGSFSFLGEELGHLSSSMFNDENSIFLDNLNMETIQPKLNDFFAVMDPLDGSTRLKQIMEGNVDIQGKIYNLLLPIYKKRNLGDALDSFKSLLTDLGKNPFVESPVTGISVISQGKFIYSGVLNWVTGDIFEVNDNGIFTYQALNPGKKESVNFHGNKGTNLICFMGNEKKPGYLENYKKTGLTNFNFFDTGYFSGPGRILYLTKLTEGVEAIASNNEPITEWSPMVHAALRSPELNIFSIGNENSALRHYGIDMPTLKSLGDPRYLRETIIITYANNDQTMEVLDNIRKNGIYVNNVKEGGC